MDEPWFLRAVLDNVEEKYKDIPEFSYQMIYKFMRLFRGNLTTFDDV